METSKLNFHQFRPICGFVTSLVFVFLIFVSTAFAQNTTSQAGPSFDCNGVLTSFEKYVCDEESLSSLDRELSVVFAGAIAKRPADKAAIVAEQKEWLKQVAGEYGVRRNLFAIERRFKNRIKFLSYPDMLNPIHPENIEGALQGLRNFTPDNFVDSDAYASDEVACLLFERYPDEAMDIFEPMGGGMDGFMPLCSSDGIGDHVPSVRKLIDAFEPIHGTISGHCNGSIIQTVARSFHMLRILAAVDVHLKAKAKLLVGEDKQQKESVLAAQKYLKQWSQQGAWEQKNYLEIQRNMSGTRKDMENYYVARFKVSKAEAAQAADFYWNELFLRLVGAFPENDEAINRTHCLLPNDLQSYLKNKTLVNAPCAVQDFTEDQQKQAELFSLLKIAMVEKSPATDVRTLLADYKAIRLPPRTDESLEAIMPDAVSKPDVLAEFLAAGVNVNAVNSFGKTTLMSAVQARNTKSIAMLLRAGAQIDTYTTDSEVGGENCDGPSIGHRTALMYALWQGNRSVIEQMLDAGANKEIKDSKGESALEYLAKNKRLSKTEMEAIKARL